MSLPAILVSERARQNLLDEDPLYNSAIFVSHLPTDYHHTQTFIPIWEGGREREGRRGREGGRKKWEKEREKERVGVLVIKQRRMFLSNNPLSNTISLQSPMYVGASMERNVHI